MIKCIATDMDGTLLNSTSRKITDENGQAILAAQSQGIEVVITTGRAYDEVLFLLEEAGLKCPVIGVNGAETRTADGKIYSTNPLDKQQAKEAAQLLLERNVYFEVYTNRGKFTKDREKSVSIITDIVKSANPDADLNEVKKFAEERAEKVSLIDDYEKFFVDDTLIYKILAFSFDLEELASVHKELAKIEDIVVSSSGQENLEITNVQAQKGIALERFAAERGIPLAETMAIGDNYNDVSMFERVGRSVAMGNADEAIKKQCDVVTAANDENGVARAIWEVLGQE